MSVRPEIIVGPPGTGKTTALLGIVDEELARGTPPERIGYVSFTVRAAEEARDRACERFGYDKARLPHFRTLHSMCFRFLGLSSSDVLERGQLQEFADYVGVRISGRYSDDGSLQGFELGDRALFMENLARVRRVPLRQQYDEDDDELPWSEVDRIARSLREFKRRRGLVDYTDMLLEFAAHAGGGEGGGPALDVLIVDEAQDQSPAQWDVVHCLARGCRRVAIAGDDDQGIYRWAGADVDYFVALPGETRVLGQSHRVPRTVQRAALEIIDNVLRRRDKAWEPRAAEGELDVVQAFHDADVDGDDVLVLARNEYVLRAHVEPELRRQGIVYEKRGKVSIATNLLVAIESWERLRAGGTVTGAEARQIYEYLSAGAGYARGSKGLTWLGDDATVNESTLRREGGLVAQGIWHDALDRLPSDDMSYLLAARRRGERLRQRPRVRISTIHGSKGGEAAQVVLCAEIAARTWREMRDNLEDEARVWYVGATRARERLTVVRASTYRECPWI